MQPHLLDFPPHIIIELTYRCNLRCPHCFVTQDGALPSMDELRPHLSRLAEILCRKVILTGGEPLLRQDLEVIIALCSEQNILVDLNSNLVQLKPAWARSLVTAGIQEVSASLLAFRRHMTVLCARRGPASAPWQESGVS